MSIYTKEDMIAWEELSPSLQELFKALQSQLNFFDKRLLGEIDRATTEEKRIKDEGEEYLAKKIQEIFGIENSQKGQILRTNRSGFNIYTDDHLFLCQKDISKNSSSDLEICYEYDFEKGTYKTITGDIKELPWRSFYYDTKLQKLWWYEYPNEYTEIKKSFSNETEASEDNDEMRIIDFITDRYDDQIRHCKVYSNGFCEQGGMYAVKKSLMQDQSLFIDNTKRYVPLMKEYKDDKYIVTLSQEISYQASKRSFGNECICTISNQPNMFVACLENEYDINYDGYKCEGFIDLVANGYITL